MPGRHGCRKGGQGGWHAGERVWTWLEDERENRDDKLMEGGEGDEALLGGGGKTVEYMELL